MKQTILVAMAAWLGLTALPAMLVPFVVMVGIYGGFITVTEAALGLAIVILLFRVRRTVMADHLDLLKG